MKIVRLLFLVCLIVNGFWVKAQIKESDKLLVQSEEMVLQNPQEALKISTFLYKQSQVKDDQAKALYISAYAQFVMGNLDQSLSDAFSAKKLADQDSETYRKNHELILLILEGLQLKLTQSSTVKPNEELKLAKINSIYQNGLDEISKHQLNAAFQEAKKLESNQKEFDYEKAYQYLLLGEILFDKKQHDSALTYVLQVQEFAEKLQNPFLTYESSLKLAKNYLALNRLEDYQTQSQKAKESSLKLYKVENNAANIAHQLIIEDLDENQRQQKQFYSQLTWIAVAMVICALLIKLILYFRNKGKLKTYTMLADYLSRQEKEVSSQKLAEKEEKIEEIEVQEEVLEESTKQKSVHILKESEQQILQGLRKFEASQKFTNKDMSLGLLAAQLNTNTKYLSEIINRQKNKNFSAYINELRINYITEKLRNDPNYLHYKVSYLAEECGFSSHSTFTTVFKSIVGVSPVIFLELIKEDNALSTSKKMQHV